MAIQLRRGDYADFDPSQLLDGELAVVLENDPDTDDGTGLYVGFGNDNVKRVAMADETADVDVATTETAGIVKPDGETITVDQDGTIHGANTTFYYAGGVEYDFSSDSIVATVDSSFKLATGVSIVLWMTTALSASNNPIYLNVNSTGKKLVKERGSNINLTNMPRYTRLLLVYNGVSWETVGELFRNGNKVLSGTSTTPASAATKRTEIVVNGAPTRWQIVIVTFSYANTATLSDLELSVVSPAGTNLVSSIRKNGEVLTEADNLKANIPYLFRHDGTYWELIGAIDDSVSPSDDAPAMDGTASAGSSTDYARADHVHPTDTSRASATNLSAHTGNTTAHVTAAERSTWNAKADATPATTDTIGLVKPDNETIAVDEDGTLSGIVVKHSDGTGAGPIVELTANGHAEQSTTTGKNLLDKSTFFADLASSYKTKNLQLIPNTTYVMSTTLPKNSNNAANLFAFNTGESGSTNVNGVWAGQSRTVTTGSDGIVVIGYRAESYTDGSLEWYLSHDIQLELGSTATPYEPYTGGAPSPSPDYPQEIQVVRGRNLIDLANLLNAYIAASSVTANNTQRTVYMPCKPNTTYSVAKDIVTTMDRFAIGETAEVPSNGVACIRLSMLQGTDIPENAGKRLSATVTTSATARYLLVWAAGAGVSPYDVNLQVELGSTATPYVPHGYVGLESVGRNMFDVDNIDEAHVYANVGSGTVRDSSGTHTAVIACKPNTVYVASKYRVSNSDDRFQLFDVDSYPTDGTRFNSQSLVIGNTVAVNNYPIGTRISASITTGPNAKYLCLWFANTNYESRFDERIQVEEGSTATAYQPYHHSTIPIPLPSRGWAAGLPDGTADVLTLDGAGKVTWERKTDEYVLEGSQRKFSGMYAPTGGNAGYRFACGISGAYISDSDVLKLLTSHGKPNGQTLNSNGWKVGNCMMYNGTFYIVLNNTTVADANTWLSANPVTVLYPLATPVTEQRGYVDLPEIPEGATITIPELDGMNVKYRLSLPTVLAGYEDRIAALEAAIAELATS